MRPLISSALGVKPVRRTSYRTGPNSISWSFERSCTRSLTTRKETGRPSLMSDLGRSSVSGSVSSTARAWSSI